MMSSAKRVNELLLNLGIAYSRALASLDLVDHPMTRLGFFCGMKSKMEESLSHEDFDVRRMMHTAMDHEIERLIKEIDELPDL